MKKDEKRIAVVRGVPPLEYLTFKIACTEQGTDMSTVLRDYIKKYPQLVKSNEQKPLLSAAAMKKLGQIHFRVGCEINHIGSILRKHEVVSDETLEYLKTEGDLQVGFLDELIDLFSEVLQWKEDPRIKL